MLRRGHENVDALFFHTQVGPVRIPQMARGYMLHRTCVFPFSVICGSCIASWCVRGAKHQRTILNAHVGPVRIPQNAQPDT
jgi:hypothetical protein